MKLQIGSTIKRLRKARDITQEEFAELLGVTCQSVSRWENGGCYPDIELIPAIAGFFGISVDARLGVDAAAEQEKIDGDLRDFQAAISRGEIDDCIAIARAGVAEFPNSYALLNKLMYALFVAGDDTGNIAEWKENMERYDAEIVALGERIIRHCPDQAIRLEATARLAFQHCEMGRRAMGRALYETLPSMKACREANIWWGWKKTKNSPTRGHICFKATTSSAARCGSWPSCSRPQMPCASAKRLRHLRRSFTTAQRPNATGGMRIALSAWRKSTCC